MNNYGDIILRALEREGKTQAWLAQELGVKPPTVSDYLKNPTQKTLRKIDKVLYLPELHANDKTALSENRAVKLTPEQQQSISWINTPEIASLVAEWHELQKELPPEVRDRQVDILSGMLRAMLAPTVSSSSRSQADTDQ